MTWEIFFTDYLDDVIALFALIIATWSAIYTYRHSGRSLKIQEEAHKMEKRKQREEAEKDKKADLEVEFQQSGATAKPRTDRLRITNRGKADAKNIRISINGKPIYDYPDILNNARYRDNSFKIPSGQVTQFRIATSKDSDKIWAIKLIWDDRAGKNNQKEFELTL